MECSICKKEDYLLEDMVSGINLEPYCSWECASKVYQPPFCYTSDGVEIYIGVRIFEVVFKNGFIQIGEGVVVGYSDGRGNIIDHPSCLKYPHIHLDREDFWPHGTSPSLAASSEKNAIIDAKRKAKNGISTLRKEEESDVLKAKKKIEKINNELKTKQRYRDIRLAEIKKSIEILNSIEEN